MEAYPVSDQANELVELRRQVAALTQERDDAVQRAERAWSAATDETMVGWHRDLALRLSEDRDIQKHAARKCRERAEAAERVLTQLRDATSERDAIATLLSDRSEAGTYAKVEGLQQALTQLREGLQTGIAQWKNAPIVLSSCTKDYADGFEASRQVCAAELTALLAATDETTP
jgi:hypothetical protein